MTIDTNSLGTVTGPQAENIADQTPDGTRLAITGQFTFTSNAWGRTATDMSLTGVDHWIAGSGSETGVCYYQAKIKTSDRYWLEYIDTDGQTLYVPYAFISPWRTIGTDSNDIVPVYNVITDGGTGGDTGSNELGKVTGQAGADLADQTADGTRVAMDGTFTFYENAAGRNETLMAGTKNGDKFESGDQVVYVAKVKADNHYWLEYQHYSQGTFYVPYATISPFRYYGEDSNAGDPVYSQGTDGGNTGGGTEGSRTPGGQMVNYPLSGASPLSNLDGYEFPMSGWVIMENGAQERTTPNFAGGVKGAKHASTTLYSNRLNYIAKTNGIDDHKRIWVKLTNGNYLPIAQLAFLNDVTRNNDDALSMSITNKTLGKTYVKDQNTEQVYEMVWPYTKTVAGKTKNGSAIVNFVPGWETGESIVHEPVSDYFEPISSDEKSALDTLAKNVYSNGHPDDVIIAYITDTHIDSYATPASERVLHSMQLMSYFAKNHPVDLVVHGGDLNDGVKDKNLSRIDVERGVDAIKTSHRPYIILQGNHDDNSGYVRDMAGYQEDQLLTNSEAWNLRNSPVLNRATGADNPNNAVFGTYDIPDSDITVVVLDGFDQPDIYRYGSGNQKHWKSFRHGYTRYSDQQVKWLKQTLTNMPSDRKVLFINHISLNGVPVGAENGGWNILDAQSNAAYESGLFEYNDGEDKSDVTGSHEVYTAITNFQSRTGNVIGYLSGHTHADNNAYSGGVQFITQTAGIADRNGDRGTDKSVPNSSLYGIDNNAWTILRISKSAGTVDQFRFGWKNQRSFKEQWNF
ncbi:metallophosphoesterase [uncultured Secundilactobacillus sp.]|uniref:metallophosphoesterase family protein n=1 Tax=uncultured Secundilactobacillus sp. TaxID=2813935 RepID=UPI00258A6E18|nr:metallophosphoesterase family protein [uncultured Secundilactobacillus sp.]